MKTIDVIKRYHDLVPFPWSVRKIKKAGFDPTKLLLEMGGQLEACADKDSEAARQLLSMLDELKLLSGGES